MSTQPRLFAFTRTNTLLVGISVQEAEKVKKQIRWLQKEKRMIEDWRLDIFCRDPTSISKVSVGRNNMNSAAASYGTHCIHITVTPATLRSYTLTVAYFRSRKDAAAMLDTIQAYLKLRYGV